MCCAGLIVKYVLIIANIVFALAGLAIIGLGIAVHLQIRDIVDLIPVNLTALSISIILIGCAVFIISYLACCGAMRESRCMLIFYALFMTILAGIKIYVTVVIFNFLDSARTTIEEWIVSAFEAGSRPAFNAMETLFECCGTTGAGSYVANSTQIPSSCCASAIAQCNENNSYIGCNGRVGEYFETFGGAIGAVLIVVIIVEIICVVFGLHLTYQIRQKRYGSA